MTLKIGWVFAEVQILKKVRLLQNDIYHRSRLCQILKKWKCPYLLNWVEYFDRRPRKYWYYQDLAQEIVKCHFSSVEVLPSSKFWKSENGPISWTEWNITWNFACTLVYWQDVAHEIAKWHLGLVEVLPIFKFWKKWKLTLKPFGMFW